MKEEAPFTNFTNGFLVKDEIGEHRNEGDKMFNTDVSGYIKPSAIPVRIFHR